MLNGTCLLHTLWLVYQLGEEDETVAGDEGDKNDDGHDESDDYSDDNDDDGSDKDDDNEDDDDGGEP